MSGPCAIPSGGAPLLDCDIIRRIQAALIPRQMLQTAEVSGKGLHDSLDGTMSDINRCAFWNCCVDASKLPPAHILLSARQS